MVYNPDVSQAKPATPLGTSKPAVKRTRSNNDVAAIVEDEGIGYAVMDYMDSSDFRDLDLAKLWDNAAKHLNALEAYLKDNSKYDY